MNPMNKDRPSPIVLSCKRRWLFGKNGQMYIFKFGKDQIQQQTHVASWLQYACYVCYHLTIKLILLTCMIAMFDLDTFLHTSV